MTLITSASDRCPYPEGTKVRYWHYATNDSVGVPTVNIGTVSTVDGQKVIEMTDSQGNPYRVEEFLKPPLAPKEPQRWFQEGVNPNNAIANN